jgi:hypothetical protein
MRAPRVFYHCYDTPIPTGGQKHTYQHVDVLNAHDIEAYVMHQAEGVRLTWFENDTPVIARRELDARLDPARDFVVLPETLGSDVLSYPGRKVVFNKNLFHGFTAFGYEQRPRDPYRHPDVVAVLAVSDHNVAHLRFAYPALPVYRVVSGIDRRRFVYRPIAEKRRQIVTIAKAPGQLAALFHLLRARALAGLNLLGEYTWVLLEDQSEREVAAILADALVLVFLSVEEGLSRLVLEALASGCLIVAYHDGPLAECLPHGTPLQYANLIAVARRLEQIAARLAAGDPALEHESTRGRAIAARYSPERQAASVMAAWRSIFAATTAPASVA